MIKAMTFRLAGLALLAMAGVAQAQHAAGSTEKAIAALEQQWTDSQKTNNPDSIAPLLADKFQYTGSDGEIMDKTAFLADAKAAKFTSVDYTELKVSVFGTTAIATGKSKLKGTNSNGKPFDFDGRFTDVWVKMPNAKWQCVSSQDSPLAK